MASNFGKGNLSIAYNPTSAFPMDARTYFEDIPDGKKAYAQAYEAAVNAEDVGSTNTKYFYGMKLLLKEGENYNWYTITKDKASPLKAEETGAGSGRPIPVSSEAEMNAVLESATTDNVGMVYKYMGEESEIYEIGALYIIELEVPEGDEVNYNG